MHRLRGFDYKRPFFYMVTLKRLPELAASRRFRRVGSESVIWYNFKRGQPDET